MSFDPMEQVLVVKAEWANKFCREGFSSDIHPDFLTGLTSEAFFMPREDAERDPTFRQIIPYTLVCHNEKYLTVSRHKAQTESRLHNKLSIGIGGHINPIDGEPENLLDAGLRRELSEELMTNDPPGLLDLQLLGLLRDDSNEVGMVHLGLVLRWNTNTPVGIREADKMSGKYLALEEIHPNKDNLESWSRLVFDKLI